MTRQHNKLSHAVKVLLNLPAGMADTSFPDIYLGLSLTNYYLNSLIMSSWGRPLHNYARLKAY